MKATHVIGAFILSAAAVSIAYGQVSINGRPAPQVKVTNAIDVDKVAMLNDIKELKAQLAAQQKQISDLKSELALVKTQAGDAVAVNFKQGQILNVLPEKLNTLEHNFNHHQHLGMLYSIQNGKGNLSWTETTVPKQFCKQPPNGASWESSCSVPK